MCNACYANDNKAAATDEDSDRIASLCCCWWCYWCCVCVCLLCRHVSMFASHARNLINVLKYIIGKWIGLGTSPSLWLCYRSSRAICRESGQAGILWRTAIQGHPGQSFCCQHRGMVTKRRSVIFMNGINRVYVIGCGGWPSIAVSQVSTWVLLLFYYT